ncbi:hypothetical protein GB937_008949 [Aspergillus fischeri]|nr:hypothetical protein GB937_008949 [Aspergillus fischeri]
MIAFRTGRYFLSCELWFHVLTEGWQIPVDEDTLVPSKKNWVDPYEKEPTQNAVKFFRRLVLVEITECWASIGATFKYQKRQVHAATEKYWTRGIRMSSNLRRHGYVDGIAQYRREKI